MWVRGWSWLWGESRIWLFAEKEMWEMRTRSEDAMESKAQVLEQGAICSPWCPLSHGAVCAALLLLGAVSVLSMLAQSLQCHLDVTSTSPSSAPEHSRKERQELQVATVTPAPPPFAFTPGEIHRSADTQLHTCDLHRSCLPWGYRTPRAGAEEPCRTSFMLLNPHHFQISLVQPNCLG